MRPLVLVTAFGIVATLSIRAQPPASAGAITINSLLDIRHPSRPVWAPDGSRVAYVWDRGGVQNVFVMSLRSTEGATEGAKADAAPGASPTPLTHFDAELIDMLAWSMDGTKLFFSRGGDLWSVDMTRTGAEPRRVWTLPASANAITLSPDSRRAAFERDGDLWVRDLDGDREARLSNTPESETAPVWSPDGTRLAFTVTATTRRQDTPGFSGLKLAFNWLQRTTSDIGVVPVDGGTPLLVGRTAGTEASPKWVDAERLVFQRVSPDLRTREIVIADAARATAQTLAVDNDPKWWSVPASSRPEPDPSPDGRRIAFLSDRDGWDHLFVVPSAGGQPVQITRGRYEVRRTRWAPDSRRIAFDVNDDPNPGQRHIAIATVNDAPRAHVVSVTRGRGADIDPLWRPDGRQLLFQHSDARNSADLFVAAADANAAPQRVTDSMPASVDRDRLVEPQFVRYAAPDGQQVPAFLFVPPGMPRTPTHPAIVWIHGDGTNENYDGWHVERNYAVYYSVHQYLLQRGYVVLAVDYRGSIGYGRDWRQGHYRDLGGKDYDDVAAGVAFLKSTGYVDASRIGVWGLSYGGFMTLQALTRTPELFRCGIDVAGVDDWRDWHRDPDGPWINGRMGSPEENADLYRRTAPIERVDAIVRPLLVLHGTADVNVPFYESVRLIDALTRAGKDVEFMMYPGEFHYFWRAHVLLDAWQRVDRFFARHLASRAASAQ
jgi:dipeptidyl aminopeptidase/acylaminoacyl peptidase